MIVDTEDDEERFFLQIQKLKHYFSKAIDNGLLKIEVYNSRQIEQMKKEQQLELELNLPSK